jgi:hypothetical protein
MVQTVHRLYFTTHNKNRQTHARTDIFSTLMPEQTYLTHIFFLRKQNDKNTTLQTYLTNKSMLTWPSIFIHHEQSEQHHLWIRTSNSKFNIVSEIETALLD